MAEVKRHAARYPWDEWFLKENFTLFKDVHYSITTNGMKYNVLHAAKVRGLRVSFVQNDDSLEVAVVGKLTTPFKRKRKTDHAHKS